MTEGSTQESRGQRAPEVHLRADRADSRVACGGQVLCRLKACRSCSWWCSDDSPAEEAVSVMLFVSAPPDDCANITC